MPHASVMRGSATRREARDVRRPMSSVARRAQRVDDEHSSAKKPNGGGAQVVEFSVERGVCSRDAMCRCAVLSHEAIQSSVGRGVRSRP